MLARHFELTALVLDLVEQADSLMPLSPSQMKAAINDLAAISLTTFGLTGSPI
jgi:hypothetical protein